MTNQTQAQKKYEFTGETKEFNGVVLQRIRRISDQLLGGWIEQEENLSQKGDCFVYGNASVYGDASVFGDAEVYGNARVSGDASVFGDAEVSGNASVYGNAWVSGNARVYGNARVSGYASVYGNARVYGNAWVSGSASVYGNASVYGDAEVSGNAWVSGSASVYGNAWVNARMIVRVSLDKTPVSINTSDNYTCFLDPATNKIQAGCRDFTREEAVKHWTETRGGTELGEERLRMINALFMLNGI